MAASSLILYRNYTVNDNYYPTNFNYKCGDNLPSINDIGILPPNGKRFKEWNWARDGSSTSYNAGEQSDDTHASYYIIWEDLPTNYKVLEEDLIAVADAINALTGNVGQLEWPDDFIEALEPPIQFNIDEVTYYAKSGMSWEEWINSNYNTDNYYITDNTYINKSIRSWVFDSNYYHIIKTDLIIANEEYATHNDPP